MASRHLPAITTSLGLLATPVVSIVVATVWLQEPPTADVLAAMGLILSGIAIGASPRRGLRGPLKLGQRGTTIGGR
jgi:drug/metabolite transporter (DMT)-like permease